MKEGDIGIWKGTRINWMQVKEEHSDGSVSYVRWDSKTFRRNPRALIPMEIRWLPLEFTE